MRTLLPRLIALLTLACLAALGGGCVFNTHGNRRAEHAIVTRFAELRGKVGKPVTLVGTARADSPTGIGGGGGGGGVTLAMRGGVVEIPAYRWPDDFIDQPVMITGTLFAAPAPAKGAPRIYRLGEVGSASKWSR